jgi:hypothetical protein
MADSSTRSLKILPASIVTNLFGGKFGYASVGVAVGSLLNLSAIYRSPSIVQPANLLTHLSERAEQSDDIEPEELNQPAFHVVFFKKLGQKVPDGIDIGSLSTFFAAHGLWWTQTQVPMGCS